MPTRGCVATGTPTSWKGVYNRFTSYPKGLGKEVWEHLQVIIAKEGDLKGFSDILNYPEWQIYLARENASNAKIHHITSDNPNPLFTEWVYVVDVEKEMVYVLKSEGNESRPRVCVKAIREIGPRADGTRVWDYGHCVYWHTLVGSFPLRGKEPDWENLRIPVVT